MANESFSEKVSVNINTSTLSGIDLLVDHGYYSNRSDFINQALRDSLQRQQSTLDRIIGEKTGGHDGDSSRWFIGVYVLGRQELAQAAAEGGEMRISGYGVLIIDEEIDDAALFAAVRSIQVKGKTVCRKSVKEHYGLK